MISVIGDGALTGGMAFEALNNASQLNSNFIIVLNDNNMSISENVGGIVHTTWRAFRTADAYQDLKLGVHEFPRTRFRSTAIRLAERIQRTKSGIKQLFIPGMFFEEHGDYLSRTGGRTRYRRVF